MYLQRHGITYLQQEPEPVPMKVFENGATTIGGASEFFGGLTIDQQRWTVEGKDCAAGAVCA